MSDTHDTHDDEREGAHDGARHDASEDARDAGGDEGEGAFPAETLAALRSAWVALPAPAPTREPADEDEATRRAVAWLAAAWRHPELRAAEAREAPAALRAAQRLMSGHDARRDAADRAPLRWSGARRQVAAAAVIVALLGAALLLRDVLDAGPRERRRPDDPVAAGETPGTARPITDPLPTDASPTDAPLADAPRTDVPVAETPLADAPRADLPLTDAPLADAPRGADAAPRARSAAGAAPAYEGATGAPLVAAAGPAPVEMRAGHTRLILFTHATRNLPEQAP